MERDKDETREAKGANDVTRPIATRLDPNSEDSRRAIRDDMLNKRKKVFTPKIIRRLSEKYLEKLGKVIAIYLCGSVIGTLLLFFSTIATAQYIILSARTS